MKTQPQSRPQRKAGKASGFRSARQFPWTKDEDALLGKLTGREVAGKLNRTLGAVRERRKFLGKPAVAMRRNRSAWHGEARDHYARLLATKSNQEHFGLGLFAPSAYE